MYLASFCSQAGQFVSYLVANYEDRFSRVVAQSMTLFVSLLSDDENIKVTRQRIHFLPPRKAYNSKVIFMSIIV